MRTIRTTFETLGGEVLVIGRKGESGASEVLIDCAEAMAEYAGTAAAMSITSPDGTIYPGDITVEDGVVRWVVNERDTKEAGAGSVRVDLVNGNGTVVCSTETHTMVFQTKSTDVSPDQVTDWTEAASLALTETRMALNDLLLLEEISGVDVHPLKVTIDADEVKVTEEKRLDAKLDEIDADLNEKLEAGDVIPKPATAGTEGQLLQIDAEGKPVWSDVGAPTQTQVGTAVSAWLDDHPEATTTVEDGAITLVKLNSSTVATLAETKDYLGIA